MVFMNRKSYLGDNTYFSKQKRWNLWAKYTSSDVASLKSSECTIESAHHIYAVMETVRVSLDWNYAFYVEMAEFCIQMENKTLYQWYRVWGCKAFMLALHYNCFVGTKWLLFILKFPKIFSMYVQWNSLVVFFLRNFFSPIELSECLMLQRELYLQKKGWTNISKHSARICKGWSKPSICIWQKYSASLDNKGTFGCLSGPTEMQILYLKPIAMLLK